MSEDTVRDGSFDEQRLTKLVAIGLPIVTVAAAGVVGVVVGPALSILVLAAGLLLGVIGLLWSSVRILSGEAVLSPELEALDMAAQGVDALASRKQMLLRALKDLQNEHAIGKIEDDDFQQLSATYRAELKTVLTRIDESLAPHRAKAEALAHAHLSNVGLADDAATPATDTAPESDSKTSTKAVSKTSTKAVDAATPARLVCPSCNESNEPDAKFCKECAAKLTSSKTVSTPATASIEDSSDG